MPILATFLETLYSYAGLELAEKIEIEETEDNVLVKVALVPDDSGVGIGNRGEAQYAVQRITRIVFGEEYGEKRIVLDVNEYRQRREEILSQLARDVALEVIETGGSRAITQQLSSQERYIIHTTIANDPELSIQVMSESEGMGRNRRVVIHLLTDQEDGREANHTDDAGSGEEAASPEAEVASDEGSIEEVDETQEQE